MITRAFREAALLIALALLPAIVSGAVQLRWRKTEPLQPGEVSVDTARMWGVHVLWVDARPRADFERKKIGGAVPLTPDEWDALVPKLLDQWDPEKAIVVYGVTSADDAALNVAHRLREELKLDNVWILQGGWQAWTRR